MENLNEDLVNIGIIGLGYIGTGVFELILSQKDYIFQKTGSCLT